MRLTIFAATVLATKIALSGPCWAVASFDCSRAVAPVEILICGSTDLADLDGGLAREYASARQRSDLGVAQTLLQEQRSWLARRNSACSVPARGAELAADRRDAAIRCLVDLYRNRIAELRAGSSAQPAQKLTSEDVVVFYSADDGVCQPLAKALTRMMRTRLGSSDVLDGYGNGVILKRAGFTLPTPLPEVSYDYPLRRRELYALDLTNDGRHWLILLSSLQSYSFLWGTAWFVLKPGRDFHPTSTDVDRPPDEDVAAPNPADRDHVFERFLIPLNPEFRKKQWQFKAAPAGLPPTTDEGAFRSAVGGFARPLLDANSTVYMLSDEVVRPRGYNTGVFALTKFTSDLRLQAVCLLSSAGDFKKL